MIMSWLWDSMEPSISDTCMFLQNVQGISHIIHCTYSKARDATQIFEIKIMTQATKEEGRIVTEYGNALQTLWQELNYYRVFEMKCTADAVILKKFIEADCVCDFFGRSQQ